MNFKFEIQGKILRQKKSSNRCIDNSDGLFASFMFETREWRHLDKYAIFWNQHGKNTIRFLGNESRGRCPIPDMCLNDLYFYIQIYANDEVRTQKLKIFNDGSVQPAQPSNRKTIKIINQFLEKVDNKIDKVVYDDNILLFYSENQLIDSIDLIDEGLIQKIISGGAPQYVVDMALSETSENPLANKAIYEILSTKIDKTELSDVAISGSYNDLTDIPLEFNPAPHTHTSEDIEDLDDFIGEDVDDFIDDLIAGLQED